MSESKPNYDIPNFAYPFKEIQNEEEYYKLLSEKEKHGNYLFSKDGFWHGGIHFNDSLTEVKATQGIRAIADGELVAFRINDKYLQNDDEENKNEGLYSNGFFLLKHKLEYPKGNILTFFSLYMHMAKKEAYFSKITGKGRNIRIGYSNSSNTIKEHTQEFDKDINIITDGKWDKKSNRTKVLYIEGLNIDLSQTPTIHKTNVDKINEVEYFETIGKVFQQNVFNQVKLLETPLQIKAGEVIGLVGENNINHGIKREVLHLEVFVSDKKKLSDFIQTARTNYNTQNTNKPKPINLLIPSGKTIYDIKEQSVVQSTKDTQPQDMILAMTEVKTIILDNKKYIYVNEEQTKAILYKDCKEIHPITFDWAKIVDESSDDDISIFTNLHKYLLPDIEDYKQEVLKVSSMYEKLFKEIDTNSNGQIEAQELEEATKNESIKKITSKFIVKHSSEWDKKVNMPNTIKTILEKNKDNISNYDRIKQHLGNEEKRVNNYAFFEECNSITDFPNSDKVFHINPIGLVGVFKTSACTFSVETLKKIDKYIKESNAKKHLDGINQACERFDINTCIRKAHFIAQISHETGHLSLVKEGDSKDGTYLTSKAYYPYYGRGLMQLTWQSKYIEYSQYIGEDCHSTAQNRDKLLVSPHAGLSAGYYWMNNKLNATADINDFLHLTCQINGGFNGFDDRYRIIKNAFKEFGISESTNYTFKDSKIYNNLKFSYAWGMWHDEGKSHLHGMTRNKEKAKAGYYRTLELIKAGKKIPAGQDVYGNKTTADLKKWATKHLLRLGGTAP